MENQLEQIMTMFFKVHCGYIPLLVMVSNEFAHASATF